MWNIFTAFQTQRIAKVIRWSRFSFFRAEDVVYKKVVLNFITVFKASSRRHAEENDGKNGKLLQNWKMISIIIKKMKIKGNRISFFCSQPSTTSPRYHFLQLVVFAFRLTTCQSSFMIMILMSGDYNNCFMLHKRQRNIIIKARCESQAPPREVVKF